MAEYIEREEAVKVLCNACGNAACPKGMIPRCSYYERMQTIPAADVRPVVKGEWINDRTIEHDGEWYCSFCGYCVDDDEPPTWNFCPNCGADMRKPPKEEAE